MLIFLLTEEMNEQNTKRVFNNVKDEAQRVSCWHLSPFSFDSLPLYLLLSASNHRLFSPLLSPTFPFSPFFYLLSVSEGLINHQILWTSKTSPMSS